MSVSWFTYAAVLFSDKTVAVELSYDNEGQAIALKAVKDNTKQEKYIKDAKGKSVQLLNDNLIFVCVFKKSEDPKKALQYLYKIKNDFAFKYCGGDISKANKKEFKGEISEFKDVLIKHGKALDTGINRDLTHKANEKVQEVAGVLKKAIDNQMKANQATDNLLEDTNNIYILAKSIEGSAKKVQPSCCQKFWACSKPCIIMFVVMGLGILAFFIIFLKK